jgi:hypothetical protein
MYQNTKTAAAALPPLPPTRSCSERHPSWWAPAGLSLWPAVTTAAHAAQNSRAQRITVAEYYC